MFKCWNCGTEHEIMATDVANNRYTQADLDEASDNGFHIGFIMGYAEGQEKSGEN